MDSSIILVALVALVALVTVLALVVQKKTDTPQPVIVVVKEDEKKKLMIERLRKMGGIAHGDERNLPLYRGMAK